MRYLPDTEHFKRLNTDELRSNFLVQDLFTPGDTSLRFVDLDRVIVGGIVPTDAAISLGAPPELDADFFAQRRELGLLNVGESGQITVDGTTHEMAPLDILYVGRGSEDVSLESDDADNPARYYLVSYPARAEHPVAHVSREEATAETIGSSEKASERILRKYIRPGAVESDQLVMGITEVQPGNVWNTMPAHTHVRRSEVYFYFDVGDEDVVFHLMGEPQETRNLVVRDEEAILSPNWSLHAGAGTDSYTFCWAMGGENQDFDDMQGIAIPDIR
jgi:4-deoxy-L-threo-5-hexosulose-uronate ketol-isomerase